MREILVVAACVGLWGCPPSNKPDASSSEVGSLSLVRRGGGVDVEVNTTVALLSLAATVELEGARVAGPARLGRDATQRDLLAQHTPTSTTLRFAVSDSRAAKLPRTGAILHIPTDGAPTRARVTQVTASVEADNGRAVTVTGYDGTPEERP
jgi:hypothetical protein